MLPILGEHLPAWNQDSYTDNILYTVLHINFFTHKFRSFASSKTGY